MKPSFNLKTEALLVCVSCRRTEMMPRTGTDTMLALIAERNDYMTLYTSIELFGICGDCRAAPDIS